MGYIVCKKCGSYYKLQDGEKADDFDLCQCGGKLKYYKYISDYLGTDNIVEEPKNHKETLVHNKDDVMAELELYNIIKDQSNLSNYKMQYSNSEKYLKNNAVAIFILFMSFFAYGIAYGDIYLDIMGLCAILFASGSYLTSKNKTIEFNSIRRIYLLGSIF